MKRRLFLQLSTASGLAPVLPRITFSSGATPVIAEHVVAEYNAYQYGLAVLHARKTQSLTAEALVSELHVSLDVAKDMIGQMFAQGYVKGTGLGTLSVEAVSRIHVPNLNRQRRFFRNSKVTKEIFNHLNSQDQEEPHLPEGNRAIEPNCNQCLDMPPETRPPDKIALPSQTLDPETSDLGNLSEDETT